MEVISRQRLTINEWDGLVRSSPDGWVYSLWGWQETIEAVGCWALEDHSFAIKEGGRLMAVVPLQFYPATGHMASTGWGGSGPVIDGRLSGKTRDKLMALAIQYCIDRAKVRGASGFEIVLSPVTVTSIASAWGVNPLVFYDMEDRSMLAQVVDLSLSEDALWEGLSPDARRQIKIARAAGLRVDRVSWPEHLDRYYQLHVATYTRTGVPPHPREYFAGIAALTADTGNSVLWAAQGVDGRVLAYHNAAWFGMGAGYHTGCSTEDERNSGTSYLLFWEAMLGAKRAGIRWYDCGAIFPGALATEKQKGLSTFKTKFGGQSHRMFAGYFSLKDSAMTSMTQTVRRPVWRKAFGIAGRVVRRLLGMTARMAHKTLGVVSTLAKSERPKIRFIQPFWSWREIVAVMFWRCEHAVSEEQLKDTFRQKVNCLDRANILFLSSGRSALEIVFRGLKSAGSGRNKVLLPSYGCLGILQPVLNAGLFPFFVDVDEDLLPSAEDMLAFLDEDTLAVLLVHLSGKGRQYSDVRRKAKELGVFVVDDYCHNLGGSPAIKDVDLAVFSFSLGKNASASAGGAIVDNLRVPAIQTLVDELDAEPSQNSRLRFRHFLGLYGPRWWRLFGKRLSADTEALKARYDLFRLSDLDSRLLWLQLGKLDKIIQKRQRNALRLSESIDGGSKIFSTQTRGSHVYTKLTACLKSRRLFEEFMVFMNRHGIEIEGMYAPLHLRSEVGQLAHRQLPRTMDVYPRVVNIPVRPNLSAWQLRRIEKALKKFIRVVDCEKN